MDVTSVPVLLYHAVVATPPMGREHWTVTPTRFAEHVEAIVASGRATLTISELAACIRGERTLDRDAVAITFDDGYADTAATIRTLLRHGVGSTVYVTTGTVGAPGMIGAGDVPAIAALDGVEVGAHTVSHPHLDELPDAAVEEEVAGSKRALEDLAGIRVSSFAYPYGAHDRRVKASVERAGYGSAAAVKDAISHLEDDPYAIARWTVTADTTAERLAGVLRGEGVPRSWRGERVRTRASRAARRARRRLR
jgi:peptidoglycan/xylan/chitin deacetylase (PgdA/CDA1 family)